MDRKNKLEVTSREKGWGEGQYRSGRHKLLGIRQVQGCIIQHREYRHYSVIAVNGE